MAGGSGYRLLPERGRRRCARSARLARASSLGSDRCRGAFHVRVARSIGAEEGQGSRERPRPIPDAFARTLLSVDFRGIPSPLEPGNVRSSPVRVSPARIDFALDRARVWFVRGNFRTRSNPVNAQRANDSDDDDDVEDDAGVRATFEPLGERSRPRSSPQDRHRHLSPVLVSSERADRFLRKPRRGWYDRSVSFRFVPFRFVPFRSVPFRSGPVRSGDLDPENSVEGPLEATPKILARAKHSDDTAAGIIYRRAGQRDSNVLPGCRSRMDWLHAP